jgi:hypothetical protein
MLQRKPGSSTLGSRLIKKRKLTTEYVDQSLKCCWNTMGYIYNVFIMEGVLKYGA